MMPYAPKRPVTNVQQKWGGYFKLPVEQTFTFATVMNLRRHEAI